MKRKTAALLAAAAALLAYLPELQNGFVDWDDERYILASRAHLGFSLAQLKWMFTTTLSGPYQPLSWLSLALDYQLWGAAPWAFHLTSALLHAANAALFYLVARELLARARPADKDGALSWAALFSALVFALHPLRVESVAWASERRDVLCGLFYLLTVWLYLRGKIPEALAAFVAALLSKGMAVTLPLTLCALDVYPLKRRAWKEKLPFFALALAFGAIGLAGQSQVEPGNIPFPGLGGRLAQAAYGLAFYVGKTLWPSGLSPLYLRPHDLSLGAWPYGACAGAALLATAALFSLRKRLAALWTAWLCYALALLPVLGLVPFGRQLAADRYSYLPCLPLAVLAGAALRASWKRPPARLLAGLVCLCLAAATFAQIPVWRDSVSLWSRAVAVEPAAPRLHNSLGFALAARGRLPEAESQYKQAIALDPLDAIPHDNLGNLMAAASLLPEAVTEYRAALALKSDFWEADSNLGIALARENKLAEARLALEDAARLKPDAAGIHKNLGLVYFALGQKALAQDELSQARRLGSN